jgi:hypothetical protein
MISRRVALGVLDTKPGAWYCVRCWAAALGASDYAELRDLVRSLAADKLQMTYDTVHNAPGEIACEIESVVCEKKLSGSARYSGWRWSVRRRNE